MKGRVGSQVVMAARSAHDNGSVLGSARPDMQEELCRELQRLLAEALVTDYLADRNRVRSNNGDGPLRDANPSDGETR